MTFFFSLTFKKKTVIVYGLMNMMLGELKINAKFLKEFTIQQASYLFNFPLRIFKKYDDMPIEVTVDSELMPFAQKMQQVMNHLGQQLEKVFHFHLHLFNLSHFHQHHQIIKK